MRYSLVIVISILITKTLEEDKPKVQVKLMSPKHFRINQNDLERLKEEIAIDMRNKIQKITQRWFINDKIREKQMNVWNNQQAQQMGQFGYQQNQLFGNPQFRELVYQQVYNEQNKDDGTDNEEKVKNVEDKIEKQKKVVNDLKEELKKIQDERVKEKTVTKDTFGDRFKQISGVQQDNQQDDSSLQQHDIQTDIHNNHTNLQQDSTGLQQGTNKQQQQNSRNDDLKQMVYQLKDQIYQLKEQQYMQKVDQQKNENQDLHQIINQLTQQLKQNQISNKTNTTQTTKLQTIETSKIQDNRTDNIESQQKPIELQVPKTINRTVQNRAEDQVMHNVTNSQTVQQSEYRENVQQTKKEETVFNGSPNQLYMTSLAEILSQASKNMKLD